MKIERSEKPAKEKAEASRGWLVLRFKERSHLHYIKVQDEAAGADGEADSFPEDLAQMIQEGDHTTDFQCGLNSPLAKRCHLGLP